MERVPYSGSGRRGFNLTGVEPVKPNEPLLFPRRVGTVLGYVPNGADISFVCSAQEGGTFYCKSDKDGRPIRATELLANRLANVVNIPTPFFSILQNEEGETFFGSLDPGSTAGEFEVQRFLTRIHPDELGGRARWLGQFLSRLYVFDIFLGNPDRSVRNFLLEPDSNRLSVFDFASIRLEDLSGQRFPVVKSPTVSVGRLLRKIHGFDQVAALEMIDKLNAVSQDTIRGLFREVPDEWLTVDQREAVFRAWSSQRAVRLSALRAGLIDGSLL